MKIHWIGHLTDICGYSQATRDYIKLLDSAGYDLSCFDVQKVDVITSWGQILDQIYAKPPIADPDIFLVHKTPWNQDGHIEDLTNLPQAKAAKKRIFMTIFETSRWPDNWKPVLEKYDSIITACTWQRQAAINLMGEIWASKIHVVPHVVEPNWEYKPKAGPYVFFSEFSRISDRKGLDVLLKAYFHAFTADDNVLLRLKLSPHGVEAFNKELLNAQKCFNWKTHPKIEVCSAFLKAEEMPKLWEGVDCYVCSARGEGFALSLAQASINGIRCLAPSDLNWPKLNWHSDFLDEKDTYDANLMPVFTPEFANVNMKLKTDGMDWLEPNIQALYISMRFNRAGMVDEIDNSKTIQYLSSQNVLSMLEKALDD